MDKLSHHFCSLQRRDSLQNIFSLLKKYWRQFFQSGGEISLYWCSSSLWSSELRKGNKIPLEVKPPVETSPHDRGRAVGERVRADDIDDRAHHGPPVLLDGSQQGLQPHHIYFTVAVQEDQDFSWGGKQQQAWEVTVLRSGWPLVPWDAAFTGWNPPASLPAQRSEPLRQSGREEDFLARKSASRALLGLKHVSINPNSPQGKDAKSHRNSSVLWTKAMDCGTRAMATCV